MGETRPPPRRRNGGWGPVGLLPAQALPNFPVCTVRLGQGPVTFQTSMSPSVEWAEAFGKARAVARSLSHPLPTPPFFRLPLGSDSSTHSGSCATLWLLSPPLHPLRGAPGCPEPPNTTHIPPGLASQLLGQRPWPAGRGPSWAFLSLLGTLGPPAPQASGPAQLQPGSLLLWRVGYRPPAQHGCPGLVRSNPRPGWDCPDPGLHWDRGPGLQTDRGLCAALRQALHFPGRLWPRPALSPRRAGAPAAQLPVPPACSGGGGGSDVAVRSRREEGDPIPGSGTEASEEPPVAAPTAICRLALGSEWADGAPDQNRLGCSPSPSSRPPTPQDGHPGPACQCPPGVLGSPQTSRCLQGPQGQDLK